MSELDEINQQLITDMLEEHKETLESFGYEPRTMWDFYDRYSNNGGSGMRELTFVRYWMKHYGHVEEDFLEDVMVNQWDYASKNCNKYRWN